MKVDEGLFRSSRANAGVVSSILVPIVVWLVLISLKLSSYQAVAMVAIIAAFFGAISCSLTEKKYRVKSLQFYVLFLALQTLIVLLLQNYSLSMDVPPDAVNYHLHGKALALHLKGQVVDGDLYSLQLIPGQNYWSPDSSLNFPYVVGSTHFLYQAYIGFIYFFLPLPDPQVVILTQATMLATLPILTFQIALSLSFRRDIAFLAACFVLADIRFSANAIWLLKDTLLTFVVLAFLVCFSVALKPEKQFLFLRVVGMTLLLTTLFCLRSHVALILCLLVVGLVLYQYLCKGKFYSSFLLMVIAAFLFSGFLKLPVWDFSSYEIYLNALTVHISSFTGSASVVVDTANAMISPSPVVDPSLSVLDSAAGEFYQRLVDTPLLTAAQTVARTLFAPYPWVVIFHGFSGSAYDLYFPGMLLWTISLPFLALGILSALKRNDMLHTSLVIFVALVAVMYVVTYGEFSTRQRQFLTPIFWMWAAYGVIVFKSWINNRKLSESYK